MMPPLPKGCPPLLYGTAWKEGDTERCTALALRAGFRGIDTANQRKHYFEEGVGRAVQEALARGLVRRDDLFLQTKFTFAGGQDARLPYDPRAPIAEQVAQSFESSLGHLGVSTLDSLVLHGPSRATGLGPDDQEAWRAMEALARSGRVRSIGVSNVSAEQLAALLALAEVPPRWVQNRCYARRGWDAEVRALCREHGLVYQGFSLLTANPGVLAHPDVAAIAGWRRWTPAQVVLRFAIDVGMLPLTGTRDPEHMRQDLDVAGAPPLGPGEVASVERAR